MSKSKNKANRAILGVIVYLGVMGVVLGYPVPIVVLGDQMDTSTNTNIIVELRIMSGDDVAVLFDKRTRSRSENLYLMGKVANKSAVSAYIKLEVTSPNNPTLRVRDIAVGWIPPNESAPVYFLSYLTQPILRTKLSEVQLKYKLISVTYK